MSERMNGYGSEHRPSSEQMVDLHVYLVPPDIWREKFNNALNQNINDTVSIGFIRVHPEIKVYALREEIEQQLGSDIVPREYVFLKSVGRSLTRLKSRQEASLKAKHFLPPQAYAPELYLLEATPEVRQAIAASSEGSTRPQTRTSYDYEYPTGNRQSEDTLQNAKYSHTSHGAGLQTYYPTLPQISPRPQHDARISPRPQHDARNSPVVTKTSPTPMTSSRNIVKQYEPHSHKTDENLTNRESSEHQTSENNYNGNTNRTSNNSYDQNQPNNSSNVTRPPRDLRVSSHPSNSEPHPDPSSLHHMAGSPRRHAGPGDSGQEDFLRPLSATPPPMQNEKSKSVKPVHHGNNESQHKHDEDSGIAGFTPDTYRDNEPLDRRKADGDANDRLKAQSPEQDDTEQGRASRSHDNGEMSDWERQRQEEQERDRRDEEERRRREEEERRRHEEDREKIAEEAKLMKTNSDEDMTRFPSPPPLRLSSPDKDTPSARARRKKQKDELLKELEEVREARRAAERQREELVKHAKSMQTKTQNRRNHARDLWKKRYFDEKKKTGPLEEQSNRLRHELDIIHKRLLSTLEGPKEKATKLNDIKPTSKNNFKVQATRLQHEIEDIRRRVDHAKMKLTSEMKLRNQAETELRALRAELMQKKINLTLSRNSHLTTYAPPAADVNFMTARSGITPRS